MDYCQSPIFETYLRCMKAAKNRPDRVQFQADRANMQWVPKEIGLLFSQLHNTRILQRLDLSKGADKDSAGLPRLSAGQQDHMAAFFRLTVCVAGERAWHMLHHTYTFPEGFAGVVSNDEAQSMECLARVRHTAELVLAAEAALRDPDHDDRVAP